MLKRIPFTLLAFLTIPIGSFAQQTPPSALHPRPGPPVRTIGINVVVTSKSGVPVAGLPQNDFTLIDDKEQRTITSFHEFDGSKVPVILLIDSVNTDFSVVAQARIEMDKFLHANGGHLSHPTALAVFTDDGVELQGGYSQDGNALAAALDKFTIGLRYITRSTGVEGAGERLNDSMKALRTLTGYEAARPGRKIILWVSPGWPLLSGPDIDLSTSQEKGIFDEITWLSTELRDAQTSIYAINPLGVDENLARVFMYQDYLKGVTKPSEANFANISLQVLATETGGLVLSSSDISGILKQSMDDAGPYYRLTFEPPPTERRDVYHRLDVKLSQRGLTAYTNTGYYDQP
ncbi:MAG: VWA domain-containing protein [Acidobacteria bacterium]|nr:VWA domain-containing protein [Acidobacteriota bacterium]